MRKWISQTPALRIYEFPNLDSYRQQKHVLDKKGGSLLLLSAQFSRTPTATFQELSTSDIKIPKVTLSDGKDVTLTPKGAEASVAMSC